MGDAIGLRLGTPEDAAALGEVAMRSKAHWGYSAEELERFRAVLSYPPGDVVARRITVAVADDIVGFASVDGVPPAGELGNLWVVPELIGTGLGRRLWLDAIDRARREGFTELTIDADPGAEGFYLAMGAERIGESESEAVPGRMLPRLRYRVGEGPA